MKYHKLPGVPFSLWHLRQEPSNAVHLFMGLDYLHSLRQRVELSRYYRVYEGRVEKGSKPGDVYALFTRDYTHPLPSDYLARPLRVSDLIVLDGVVWYIDPIGYRDVTDEVGGVPDEQV